VRLDEYVCVRLDEYVCLAYSTKRVTSAHTCTHMGAIKLIPRLRLHAKLCHKLITRPRSCIRQL